MSTDENDSPSPVAVDLDAIERRSQALTFALDRDHIGAVASFGYAVAREDIPALVAEARALRAKVARARTWIANCVDPAEVGVEAKGQMLAALDAEAGRP